MKINWKLAVALSGLVISASVLFNNCGGFQSAGDDFTTASATTIYPQSILGNPLPINGSENYVVPITMSPTGLDIPTVSVTVCVPGTSNCQTIDNILLDTGSTGLRIYASVIAESLPLLSSGGNDYGECYQFGSAMAFWGPIQTADVILGGKKATNVNLQTMNSTFMGGAPADCSGAGTSSTFTIVTQPSDTGWNGILGVQQFTNDCGPGCAPDTTAAIYYRCAGNACSGITMPTNLQVPNPIAAMSTDNNGFVIQIPNVPISGATSMAGAYLVMGIGTEAHNVPSSGVTALSLDGEGNLSTLFQGNLLSIAFMDTGSWDLSFPPPTSVALATCSAGGETMYCPSSTVTLSAQMQGATGVGALNLDFNIISGATAWDQTNPNYIFNDIADPGSGLSSFSSFISNVFDWGLPVFFGKTVYFGMDGSTIAPLGAGPFDAM